MYKIKQKKLINKNIKMNVNANLSGCFSFALFCFVLLYFGFLFEVEIFYPRLSQLFALTDPSIRKYNLCCLQIGINTLSNHRWQHMPTRKVYSRLNQLKIGAVSFIHTIYFIQAKIVKNRNGVSFIVMIEMNQLISIKSKS